MCVKFMAEVKIIRRTANFDTLQRNDRFFSSLLGLNDLSQLPNDPQHHTSADCGFADPRFASTIINTIRMRMVFLFRSFLNALNNRLM